MTDVRSQMSDDLSRKAVELSHVEGSRLTRALSIGPSGEDSSPIVRAVRRDLFMWRRV